MAEIVKELTLEVYSANRIKAIIAKQYDYKSRFLLIRLTDSGEDISVEPSSVVTVNAFRPNGESAAFLGSAESDGRVLVPLSYWMLELEGTVKCDVSIVDTEGRKLSSTNFQIEVERANYSGDDIEPDEHYDLLVELLAEVAQAQEAENARVAAESARVTAENGRVSAETARQTAETARATAETARDTAEGARSSAETARGTAETARASAETTRQANEASRVSAEAARAAAETAREEAEEEREHALDDYAKKDGYYEGLTAGLSDNLTYYSEDSGIKQTQHFFLEGTATGNGEFVADAGTYAFLQEKRGNMVCVNQLVDTSFTGTEVSFTEGYLTATNTAGGNVYRALSTDRNFIKDHKYLVFLNKVDRDESVIVGNSYLLVANIVTSFSSTSIVTPANDYTGPIGFVFGTNAAANSYYKAYISVVDLTQWFNGNIPAYLLSHPEAFGRYYKGSLAYEPGRLEPATGRYLTSVGRNIWDEEWEVGGFDANGNLINTNTVRSKNFIDVSGITEYYFKCPNDGIVLLYDENKTLIPTSEYTWQYHPYINKNSAFTVTPNAKYMRFCPDTNYGTTYKYDITISRYYPGESGYDKYYPHEVLATIDTGTESLYSAGSAYDSKVPSGLITRRIGSVDLGTLHWAKGNDDHSFYANITNMASGVSEVLTLMSANFVTTRFGAASQYTVFGDKTIGRGIGQQYVYAADSNYSTAASFKAAMSGVILYYELATPTTEQGTPFQENVPIDDFGQLSWSNTDVPQGNQIFYPVDYKAAIDTLINYMDGDITGLAKRGSLTDTDPQTLKALIDYVNGKIPAAPTTDGTYDLVCTVTNGQPSYSWIART